ncbi:MAG: DUF484 family protein [Rhodospirillales bacterium]|nr:DUF484 family protein [Rhodospirillales bacterium]
MTGKTIDKATEPVMGKTLAGADGDLSADAVAEYLRSNPDFFVDKVDLLAEMSVPDRWSGDGVVDMQRFLAERRLGEIDDLRDCAQEVIETSRSNMSVQTRTHAAIMALLAAADVEQLLRVIDAELPLLLDVDVVMVGLEPPEKPGDAEALWGSPDIHRLYKGAVDALLGEEKSICLLKNIEDDGTIFGAGAGLVSSAALARVRPGRGVPDGLIALGSRSDTFHANQGTELFTFFARVVESCLHRLAETAG